MFGVNVKPFISALDCLHQFTSLNQVRTTQFELQEFSLFDTERKVTDTDTQVNDNTIRFLTYLHSESQFYR